MGSERAEEIKMQKMLRKHYHANNTFGAKTKNKKKPTTAEPNSRNCVKIKQHEDTMKLHPGDIRSKSHPC